MDSLRSPTTADLPPDVAAPRPDGAGLVWARIAQGAAMAAVVAVGVPALSLFPPPRPASAPAAVRIAAQALAPAAPQAAPQLRPRIAPPPPPAARRHVAVVARETRSRAPTATLVVVAATQRP